MQRKKFTLFWLIPLAFLAGCSANGDNELFPKPGPGRPAKVPALERKEPYMSALRFEALKEMAMTVGSQGGLARRSEVINHNLKKEEKRLFEVFNFNAMVLKDNVLPPVLEEGQYALHLDNDETIRLANRVYRIVAPPRFVTAPPIWRDYLWMNYTKPDIPDKPAFLPRSKRERELWNKYVRIGWKNGVRQANDIFEANLNRLKRDYEGMALYRVLLRQNMVTPPYVAKTDLGITGDENEMRIDDKVLRISATSKLNLQGKTWKPVIYNPKKDIPSLDNFLEKLDQ